jgi:hypothetical protein
MLIDIFLVARGEERRSFMIAILLAFFNQVFANARTRHFLSADRFMKKFSDAEAHAEGG